MTTASPQAAFLIPFAPPSAGDSSEDRYAIAWLDAQGIEALLDAMQMVVRVRQEASGVRALSWYNRQLTTYTPRRLEKAREESAALQELVRHLSSTWKGGLLLEPIPPSLERNMGSEEEARNCLIDSYSVSWQLAGEPFLESADLEDQVLIQGLARLLSRPEVPVSAEQFRRVLVHDREAASSLLLERSEVLMPHLTSEDLAPLLEAPSQEIRLRTIAACRSRTPVAERQFRAPLAR